MTVFGSAKLHLYKNIIMMFKYAKILVGITYIGGNVRNNIPGNLGIT